MLLKNNAGGGNHWLGLSLVGTACNRDAVGARISWSAGGKSARATSAAAAAFLSSHDPREVLGLGTATKLDYVEVRWPLPSKRVERWTNLEMTAIMH